MTFIRRYLIAGLLVWLPIGVTIVIIRLLVGFMDKTLTVIPRAYHPDTLLGIHLPGLGVVLTLLIVFLTGVIVANFFGRRMIVVWESLLARIPLVRTIYTSVKQIAETVFASNGQSFRKVLLVEYPRRGIWTLAFQTGKSLGEIKTLTGSEVVNVFVPTTPNPTSGFFIMVPREDIVELQMSVDDGLKMIMSMGVIVPDEKRAALVEPAVAQNGDRS